MLNRLRSGSFRLTVSDTTAIRFKPAFPPLGAALFGSRARGDFNEKSDIDILILTGEGSYPVQVNTGHVSASYYPFGDMCRRARDGDLFACHIVKEGVPLWDPAKRFDRLRSEFHYKKSYEDDIAKASDLGWFFVMFHDEIDNKSLINKRISWVVRTILIAFSVGIGLPTFSPVKLSKLSNYEHADLLINSRSHPEPCLSIFVFLQEFLTKFELKNPLRASDDPEDFREHFLRTNNRIGLATIESFFDVDEVYP